MSWAHYILQVNIYLLVFYGFYKIFLDKETYFMLNRAYLISAGLLSIFIPYLRFEWFINQTVTQPVYVGVDQLNQYISKMAVVDDLASKFTLGNVIVLIYVTGIIFFTARLLLRLILVNRLLKIDGIGTAFSFFNKRVVDKNLPELATIQSHEEIHIRQLHSADIIFFELIGIIAWFNPIIYFYKHTIKNIHEYLADEEAAKFNGDKEQYALLLLSSAFGVTPSNLTNSFFNKSLLKKRIYMLHKQRSKKTAILKYGLFLPLFAVTLVMSSATIRNDKRILTVAEQMPLNDPLTTMEGAFKPFQDDKVFDFVSLDQQPTFPGGMENFYKYLGATTKYPPEAQRLNKQGKVFLSFIIERDGSLTEIKVDRRAGYGLDEEAIRVLKASPKWVPGMQNGNKVRVKYNLPIAFALTK